MDERKGQKKYCLYWCDPKYPATGDPVCQSDNIDDLREYMFTRWKDETKTPRRRHVLTERGKGRAANTDGLRIPVIEDFGKLRGKEAVQGNGWYCKNPKCERLIATEEIKSFDGETLVRLTCPHCGDHKYHRCSDYGWKRWKLRNTP